MSNALNSHFVGFRSGEVHFCLPHTTIEEILPIAHLERPPCCPAILEGLLPLSGKLRPVMNLARLLDLPIHPIEKFTPMVILKDSGRGLVLLVEAVSEVFAGDKLTWSSLDSKDSFNGCCYRVGRDEDHEWFELNLQGILTHQENKALESFQIAVEARAQSFISTS